MVRSAFAGLISEFQRQIPEIVAHGPFREEQIAVDDVTRTVADRNDRLAFDVMADHNAGMADVIGDHGAD